MTTPTPEFLEQANKHIRATLMELRPELLAAHGAIEHSLKDDKSVVTEMDVMVEKRLCEALAFLDPSIGFAGEETGADYDQPTFWLVDPIDGTEPFIRGLPFATNMIALIHNGEPIMSVIYNFVLDEYFHAVKGGGATKNGHPIHVSKRTLDRGFIHFGAKLRDPALRETRDNLRLKIKSMTGVGAAGFLFAGIASGALDGAITLGNEGGPWDMAPGALLVIEAGGRVENFHSSAYSYRDVEMVASNRVVFDELKQLIEAGTTA